MLIEKDHPELSIVQQCELLQVSRSGFYYEPVMETEENLAIMRWMDEQYLDTLYTPEHGNPPFHLMVPPHSGHGNPTSTFAQ